MKYGSRKFIVAMFILVGSTVLCAYNRMDGDKVMLCYGLAGAGYGLSNVMSKKSEVK